ncbi:MAG TPA: hypothetical protein VFM93_13940 [Candidatus Limnocylindria bacterium]|nr:hypothetical protein [Candidatus Limnocylindria bacterium]
MRLYAEPIPVRLVWSEGEPEALRIGTMRLAIAELVRRWRVDAEWWENGADREYLTVRTVDGQLIDLFTDRRTHESYLQRIMD